MGASSSRIPWALPLGMLALLATGCGIDGSLTAGLGASDASTASDGLVVADVSVKDAGSGDGGGSPSDGSAEVDSSPASFPDAAPVCDSGSTLGGTCVGITGCCTPLQCTSASTCQWACTQNGACANDSNCCPGSYCGPAGVCTCVQKGASCVEDNQCCSYISGGGCDYHGDAGKVCGSGG